MRDVAWKKVQGYEDFYEISNYGDLKSLSRPLSNHRGDYFTKEKMLKKSVNFYGYIQYILRNKGKCKSVSAHRLVALHFIDRIENNQQVNHIDGNKLNNYYKNLEWVSQRENMQHAFRTGLNKASDFGLEAKAFAGQVLVYDKNGNHIDTLIGTRDTIEKGYEFRAVSACLHGKRKTHKGCTFKRIPKEKACETEVSC